MFERCPLLQPLCRGLPPLLIALALLVAPAAALAQDGYVTLRGTNQALAFDPSNPAVVSDTVNLGGAPSGVAMSPDGTTAYVVVANTFVYRIVNGALDPVPVTASLNGIPEQIAVSPDGGTLYVSNAGSNSKVHVIDVATGALTNVSFAPGSFLWGIDAVTTPVGDRVFVSGFNTDQVTVLDAAGNFVTTVNVGDGPLGVAAAPAGDRVYVANNDNSVSVIDTATNAVFPIAGVGAGPQELTVSADGSRVYVSLRAAGDVAVIDTTTNTVVDTIDLGSSADRLHGISFSADGNHVVVAHFGGRRVSVIDTLAGNSFVTTGPISTSQPRYLDYKPLPSPAPPEPDNVAFAAFGLRQIKILTRGRLAGNFQVNGRFELDVAGGDGIDPASEDVTLSFAGSEWIIPSGSFEARGNGRLHRFDGTINGTTLQVRIIRTGHGSKRYDFDVLGGNGAFQDPANLVEVCVTIGDDFGCRATTAPVR